MNDALIAIIIVIAAVIPVAATINYAYYSITSSREISTKFNEFGNEIDEFIWNHMNEPASFPLPSGTLLSPSPITANGASVPAEIVVFQKTLDAGRRQVPARLFMIKKP